LIVQALLGDGAFALRISRGEVLVDRLSAAQSH
jgi:hypothetical protein